MEFNIRNNNNQRQVVCIRNDSDVLGGGVFAHLLTIGEKYTVDYVDMGSWTTMVALKEFPDKLFNSVLFEEIEECEE